MPVRTITGRVSGGDAGLGEDGGGDTDGAPCGPGEAFAFGVAGGDLHERGFELGEVLTGVAVEDGEFVFEVHAFLHEE